MKFVLEFDVSGEVFTEGEPEGMISGYAIGAHLGTVLRRIDGHSMEVGEKGVILDIENDQKIGSWRIVD